MSWTIQFKVAKVDGGFEWLYLESFYDEAEARQALADHSTSPAESDWFRLVPSTLMYDEMYNAAYCEPCYEAMNAGVYDWADEEYMSRLALYTHTRFKDMMRANFKPPSKQFEKFGFSKWMCGCCERKFMGV